MSNNQAKYGENLSLFGNESKGSNSREASTKKKATATQQNSGKEKPTEEKKTAVGDYGVGNLSKGALDILSKVFGGSGKIGSARTSASYGANINNNQGGKK